MNNEEEAKRISRLDPKIREYIKYGKMIGIFNSRNMDSIIQRLESIEIKLNNSLPGAASVHDDESTGKKIIQVNEKIIKQLIEDGIVGTYFEDEILFHECSHVTNEINKAWEKSASLENVKNRLWSSMSFKDKLEYRSYSGKPIYRYAGFGYGVLDEFIAQSVAQKMVETKYGKLIYNPNVYKCNLCSPKITYTSTLADSPIFEPFVKKFTECLYGKEDTARFIKEAFESNFERNIYTEFKLRKSGMKNLYRMLGHFGNLYIMHEGEQNRLLITELEQDPNFNVGNPRDMYKSITELVGILNYEIDRKKQLLGLDVGESTSPFDVDR